MASSKVSINLPPVAAAPVRPDIIGLRFTTATAAISPHSFLENMSRLFSPDPRTKIGFDLEPITGIAISKEPKHLSPGTNITIGSLPYVLTAYLGGGSYGQVWAAYNTSAANAHNPANIISIKFIRCDNDKIRTRAVQEACVGKVLHTLAPDVCLL